MVTVRLLLLAGILIIGLFGSSVVTSGAENDEGLTRGFYAFPTGPSSGWVSVRLSAEEFSKIQTLTLPRGNYIVNGIAALASSGTDLHLVDCHFLVDGIGQAELTRGSLGGLPNNFTTLPLTIGLHLKQRQEIAMACRAEHPDVVFSQPSPITAIRVDRLTIQDGFVP